MKQALQQRINDLRVDWFGTDDNPRVGTLARPARAVIAPMMKFSFNIEVIGADRIPDEGGAIISANHRSFFDTPVLMATAPRPVTFLGKAEYMDSSWTKFAFPAMGMVPIKRQNKKASVAALETAAELLTDGQLVGIYPEGTRSRDGLLHRGRTGVAQLALMTGAPIVPVGLIGTQRAQPIGAKVPMPFKGKIRVEYGEPVWPDDFRLAGSRLRRHFILSDVMESIAAMTDQRVADDFKMRHNPLNWGGTESVYRVTRSCATGLSWRQAAERVVDAAYMNLGDARVAEVQRLACSFNDSGRLMFQTEMSLSSLLRSGRPRTDKAHPSQGDKQRTEQPADQQKEGRQ